MSEFVFGLRPSSLQCREALCLEDYEEAWNRHQNLQFQRVGREAMGPDFEKFRRYAWGDSSYASGMGVRVGGQVFSWSDIAVNGRIDFTDVQSLMELGLVEFLVPSHRCVSSHVPPSVFAIPVRNRREFKAMIREMQDLRPLHGEGMGNAFWPLCLPEIAPSTTETTEAVAVESPAVADSEADPCSGGEVDYYDADLDKAICFEEEPTLFGGTLRSGLQNLASATLGHGLGLALAAGAIGIGKIASEY